MTTTTFGHHKKQYIIEINAWAKRLEAEEVTIHANGSVTLMCKDGCICHEYIPSPKELRR